MTLKITTRKCWVCLGSGVVSGPLHPAPCPNPYCPHRKQENVSAPFSSDPERTG
jgi:hypothetical protein